MALTLPRNTDTARLNLPDDVRKIVVVGANGAGKTRFTSRMCADAGSKAFQLSAISALYVKHDVAAQNHEVDRLYLEAVSEGMPQSEGASTQFERIVALLMHHEMINLIKYKLAVRENPHTVLGRTPLDRVIDTWQEMFPDNKVLLQGSTLSFLRQSDDSAYPLSRLSTGEKAVLYYLSAICYAPKGAVIFVETPEMFLHPTATQTLWNHIENMRADCTFVYATHDLDFAASRIGAATIWVRSFDAVKCVWDYQLLPDKSSIPEEVYRSIIGTRKPVLFIEGDAHRSIDSKLYPLVFPNYSVQSLGSCNKVIEATRTFNDLNALHHMDSRGIVDRDRRDVHEVAYLRKKKIMVPEVAEIENLLLLEDVVREVAEYCGRNGDSVASKVKRSIIKMFSHELEQQALLHTRHKVKRIMEYRTDGRFPTVDMLERHLHDLLEELDIKNRYKKICAEFRSYVANADYNAVLRVYNQKSMLPSSNVAELCGLKGKNQYLETILTILRGSDDPSERVRRAIVSCLNPE